MIKTTDVIEESHVATLDPGYVVYDSHRARRLAGLLDWYRRRGIVSVGRYGAWEYSAMEDSMIAGRKAAEAF